MIQGRNPSKHASRVNLVLVVLDTVRADHLSCYGYQRPSSPVLDDLAQHGVLFHQAISPACWTLPVHASWFTGLYPLQHGANQSNPRLDARFTTLAEALKTANYATIGLSKNPFVSRNTGLDRGFHTFKEYKESDFRQSGLPIVPRRIYRHLNHFKEKLGFLKYQYAAGKMLQDSIDLVSTTLSEAGRPFFLFVNLMDAHIPRRPPKPYVGKFVDRRYRRKEFSEIELGPFLTGQSKYTAEYFEAFVQYYDAAIAYIDHEIGTFMQGLKKLGILQNTVVAIVADHGEHLGEHNLLGHNLSLYDELIRVPLVLYCPDLLPKGLRITAQVETKNLFNTFLDIAGLKREAQGSIGEESLVDVALKGPSMNESGRFAFAEDSDPAMTREVFRRFNGSSDDVRIHNSMRCVRTSEFKYIWAERTPHEFYDLKNDPGEAENLIHTSLPGLSEAKRALENWVASMAVAETQIMGQVISDEMASEEVLERLRVLGYI